MIAPYLTSFVALLSIVGQVASFSTPPPGFATGGMVRNKLISKPSSFSTPSTTATTARNAPSSKLSSTALGAIPNWALYSLSHIIGGTSGTPAVIRATKTWYRRLPKPSWTPPNGAFAPTWTILYAMMGIAVSRIVSSGSPSTRLATKLWTYHYCLNVIWPTIFFGFQNLRTGLIINLSLLGSLGYIIPLFHSIDKVSAFLLIPYFMWLLYATKLNETICKLNPLLGGTNKAKILADLFKSGDGTGYNDAMCEYDIKILQIAAAKYAGL